VTTAGVCYADMITSRRSTFSLKCKGEWWRGIRN